MNIGIIGLGFMGVTHFTACSGLADVHVTAISSRDARALEGDVSHIGGNLGQQPTSIDVSGVSRYRDWRELVADRAVEAVDICLPTDLHESVASAALASGKDVLCEKPMALDYVQCRRMLDAAQQHGRILMIGHVLRFWPDYLRLRQFVQSGDYGSVRAATFSRICGAPDWSQWLLDTSRSGGAVLDLLIHDIDQILTLFGHPVAVRAKSLAGGDTLSATLLYDGGPEVRILGGWLPAGTPFSMSFQVRADRALLELSASGLKQSDAAGNQTTFQPPNENPYASEIAYFADCCRENRQPAQCPPEESAAAVKLASALRHSRSLDGELVQCDR